MVIGGNEGTLSSRRADCRAVAQAGEREAATASARAALNFSSGGRSRPDWSTEMAAEKSRHLARDWRREEDRRVWERELWRV